MRYSTGRDGTAESRAGTPIHLYTKRTQPFVRSLVRSSVGSPLTCTCTHTKRAGETRQTRRAECARHTAAHSLTDGESGKRAQAARQTGRQAGKQRQAGRQAGRQGTLLRQRHCLPALGSIRSRSGGRVSPTLPSSSTATLCPCCPPLTRLSARFSLSLSLSLSLSPFSLSFSVARSFPHSLILSGAPFRAAISPSASLPISHP